MSSNIQNNPLNVPKASSSALKAGGIKNNDAYYAKKGEPMYLKEMDADEDGIITLDEFKDYCIANDISAQEMIKMLEVRNAYHLNKKMENAQKEQEKDCELPEEKTIYAKKGDSNYDERMDLNNDEKVTYKEYIEYCKENACPKEEKPKSTSEDKIQALNEDKASSSYLKTDEKEPPKNIVECEA